MLSGCPWKDSKLNWSNGQDRHLLFGTSQASHEVLALNSRHRCALINWPLAKLSRLKLSFGECGLSFGNANPRSNESARRIFLNTLTMGIEPPSRRRTGSRLKASLSARKAAWAR